MSPKELMYIEDALGHETFLQSQCRQAAQALKNPDLKAYVTQLAQEMAEQQMANADHLYAELLTTVTHNNGLGAGKTPVTFEATTALREAAEYKGYTVTWNAEDGSIALTKGNDTVTITLGSATALKNGQEVALTAAPYAEDGVTYVPMSLIQSL